MSQVFVKVETMKNTEGKFEAVVHVDNGKIATTYRLDQEQDFIKHLKTYTGWELDKDDS